MKINTIVSLGLMVLYVRAIIKVDRSDPASTALEGRQATNTPGRDVVDEDGDEDDDTIASTIGALMEISGPAFPNGDNITINGTIQEFYNLVHQMNPDYDEDFKDVLTAQRLEAQAELAANGMTDNNSTLLAGLERRDDATVRCKEEWGETYSAKCIYITEGVGYLRGVTASCTAPEPPDGHKKVCHRVSCSWDSGIFICNFTKKPIAVRCDRIANMASIINGKCCTGPGCPGNACNRLLVRGRKGSGDGWRVDVRHANC